VAVPSPDLRFRSPIAGSELAAIGAVAALATSLLLSPEHIEDGPIICPFRRLTGLPCPGCGLTRSWVYLAHGDWGAALAANPFGLVTVAGAMALLVLVVRARTLGRPAPDINALLLRPWMLTLLGAWFAYGVVRMAQQGF